MTFYTNKDLKNVCRAYSKDWDKLNNKERNLVLLEAEKWLKAFQEILPGRLFKQN